MKVFKRGLAMLLAITLVVTLLPETAFAQETQEPVNLEQEEEAPASEEQEEEAPASEEQEEEAPASEEQEEEAPASEEEQKEETPVIVTEEEQKEETPVAVAEEEKSTREVVEEYNYLTVNQPLHHTTTSNKTYVFAPEESGWYLFSVESKTDCSFESDYCETLYYTENDGVQEEHRNGHYLEMYGTKEARAMWLNKDEKYFFTCDVTDYESSKDISIELLMRKVEIKGIQTVKNPTRTSYDCLDTTGTQVEISFLNETTQDTITITDNIQCDIGSYNNGEGYSDHYLDIFKSIAYDYQEYMNNDLDIVSIDGNTEYDFSTLKDGSHTAVLKPSRGGWYNSETDEWEYTDTSSLAFKLSFQVKQNNIESIQVIESQTEYTEGFDHYLDSAQIQINYNDGTESETLWTYNSNEVRQYLEYTVTEDGESKVQTTTSIDEYLENGGSLGTATVKVTYRGMETSYVITIAENPYKDASIELVPKRTVYYAGCSYSDENGMSSSGDYIEGYDFKVNVTLKDGSTQTFDDVGALPNGYYYDDFGLKLTNEYGGISNYRCIDNYIDAGGTTGTQKVYLEWNGLEASAEIQIVENPYDHIKVVTAPSKTKYLYNSYVRLSLSGLVFHAYKDAEETDDNYDVYTYNESEGAVENWSRFFDYSLGGHNDVEYLKVGKHPVHLNFMGKPASFEIEVVDKMVEKLEITQAPTKLEYYAGEASYVQYSGLTFDITDFDGNVKHYKYGYDSDDYDDDEEYDSTYEDWWEISDDVSFNYDIDWDTPGTYKVTVSYLGASDTFEVSILESPVESIEVLQLPTKTSYFQYENYEIDLTGLKYRITFSDGTVAEGTVYKDDEVDYIDSIGIPYGDSYYYMRGSWANYNSDDEPSIGENSIILKFIGKTYQMDGFTVEQNPVKAVEFVKNPDKMTYWRWEDTADLYGSQIKITYVDGTTQMVEVTEHTNRVTVEGAYQNVLRANLYNNWEWDEDIDDDVYVGKRLSLFYMNYNNSYAINFENPDITQMEAEVITDESCIAVSLNKENPYKVYSFTPEETKTYYFYSTGDWDTYVSLYQGNEYIDDNDDGAEDNNFYMERELQAGTTYYFLVKLLGNRIDNVEGTADFQCILSSTISGLNQLEVEDIAILSAPKTSWYEFESQSIYADNLSLRGTEIKLTYTNGWTDIRTLKTYGSSTTINGTRLSVAWKYIYYDEEEWDEYVEIRDDNALVYTYGDKTREVPLRFKVPSPVESLEITANPFAGKSFYKYQIEEYEYDDSMEGLAVTVHYKDERADETIAWQMDEEYGEVYNPYLNGYRAYASVKTIQDDNDTISGAALTVTYMGCSVTQDITLLENPVTEIQLVKAPVKMEFYSYEDWYWDDNYAIVDLYGLEMLVTYQGGATETIKVTSHGNTLKIENAYQAKLYGSVEERYNSTSWNTEYWLYIRYMGYRVKVGEYALKDFSDLTEVEQIQPGDEKAVALSSAHKYQVYKFVAPETGNYIFKSTGDRGVDNKATLYSSFGKQLAYNDDGDEYGHFELSYSVIQGKTYYLVVRMYSLGDSGEFTCTVQKGEEIAPEEKSDITNVNITLPSLTAGEEFPDLDDLNWRIYGLSKYSWYGDADNNGYADYGTAHRVKLVLSPVSDYQFTSSTQVIINDKRITAKSVGNDGSLTVYYTFPYTACKVTVPGLEGYELDQSQNTVPDSVNYGENYKFRYIKNEDNTAEENLIVKADDTILTADEEGYYTLENVRTNVEIFVKTEKVEVKDNEVKLSLHNQSEDIYDILVGQKNYALADNATGEKVFPVLASYVDGSDQFFYGWYQGKDDSLNGKGTRVTSKSILQNDMNLYAKWASGLFTTILNNKEIHYKILSIDENNKLRVQVGDGSNGAAQKASVLRQLMAFATGSSDTLVIPENISTEGTDLEALGIKFESCEVVAIAENAFAGETGISSIQLPSTIESIGANAFDGCSSLEEITIPENVSNIGAGAFNGCESLESVSIPAGVTEIAEGTFSGCSNLTSVTMEDGVTAIGADAFNGCSNLSTITLPDTIESIDANAFDAAEGESNLTIICSSEIAQSDVVQSVKEATGATVQEVNVTTDYKNDAKHFTYGDTAWTVTANVTVDGEAAAGREIKWTYTETDAYSFSVSENAITVTPNRTTTEDETITIKATDVASGKSRMITLETEAIDLGQVDTDEENIYTVEVQAAANLVYTGKEICPQVVVKKVSDSEVIPADGYEVSYKNNVNAGKASVIVKGKGNYTGTLTTTFTIKRKAQTITASDIQKTVGDTAFSIGAKTDGDGALSYTVDNDKVVKVGTNGAVTIVGAGTAKITIQAAQTTNYAAATKEITITVAKKAQTITASDFKKKVGDAAFKVNASASGNGTLSYSSNNVNVVKVDAAGLVTVVGVGTATITIKAAATAQYADAAKTITITVVQGDAKLVVSKTSYTKALGSKAFSLGATAKTSISYKSSDKKVATVSDKGKVTLKGCGKAVITITAGDNNYQSATKKVTIKVVPKTAKIKSKSVKSKKAGQLTITWNRQKEADGYVIQYSTDKKFKKNVKSVTIKKNKTTSTTLKKLSKGKKYYVRVKAYKTIDKKKAYGTTSKVVNKKVKK